MVLIVLGDYKDNVIWDFLLGRKYGNKYKMFGDIFLEFFFLGVGIFFVC